VADRTEGFANLGGDIAGAVPDDEGRESQHQVPVQLDAVLPVHVVPPLGGVHVMNAVDLHDDPGLFPHGIQPAAPVTGVIPYRLPGGFRQAEGTDHQAGEVDLGQGLRASHDVVERAEDDRPAAQSRAAILDITVDAAALLLASGDELGGSGE
jgi:hypothetical protein